MRILYVNHYAGSREHGMEFRPFYFARKWLADGHEPTIVAASFSHLRQRQPSASFFPRTERIEGVRYLWLPTPRYSGNGIGRILNMLAFLAWLVVLAPALAASRPQRVIASSTYPLDVFPTWLVARLAGARLIFELHDLWPLTPIEVGGYSPRHPYIRVLQAAEDFACRRCDELVSLLPLAREHLVSRGLNPPKFKHIPNGVELSEWEHREELSQTALDALKAIRLRGEKRFLVGYVGGHGLSNALEVILEAAGLLKNEPLEFVFVGKGPEKQQLEESAKAGGLTNVTFLPPVSKRQVPALLEEFDVLCLSWRASPLYRFGVSPNKIFDYMMSRRPIVQALGAGNDLVAEAGCGTSTPPEDPRALADGLLALARLPRESLAHMGARGRAFVLQHHTVDVLARRFLQGDLDVRG